MRISDWSSDVCSSDLPHHWLEPLICSLVASLQVRGVLLRIVSNTLARCIVETYSLVVSLVVQAIEFVVSSILYRRDNIGLPSRAARVDRNCFIADIYLGAVGVHQEGQNVPLEVRMGIGRVVMSASPRCLRSEEHTSELQSLMRISYAVFCLKKKN